MNTLKYICSIAFFITVIVPPTVQRRNRLRVNNEKDNELSLWIDEEQVRKFSGMTKIRIYAIENGIVSAQIRDPMFSEYLPIIPSEVNSVNLTWRSGKRKYHYNFDRLESLDENLLSPPKISIKSKGKVPQEQKGDDKIRNYLLY